MEVYLEEKTMKRNDMRVYVVLPALKKTGGTELGHQLVEIFNTEDIEAQVAYIGVKKGVCPLPDAFKEYVSTYEDYRNIKDEENTIVIFSEIYLNKIDDFKKAKRIVWWMSVDNCESQMNVLDCLKSSGLIQTLKWIIKGNFIVKKQKYLADLHLYQSEYARLFLQKQGLKNVLPLSDYINDSFFLSEQKFKKENIALYNPRKGINITKKIISATSDIKWVPLQNLTTKEVGELLRKGKLYIDFGHHPGKDRFPREAVTCGCCVITGRKGAANNSEDIPIPQKYKFQDNLSDISDLKKMIHLCIEDYDKCYPDFDSYRNKIKSEKETFYSESLKLIEYLEKEY